jgi:HlyD family secretion protein
MTIKTRQEIKKKPLKTVKMKTSFIAFCIIVLAASCKTGKEDPDASGTFETEETVISADATGTIRKFNLEEGESLQAGQFIGYVDSVQLYLKKKQLEAQVNAILGQTPDIQAQIATLNVQLQAAETDQQRVSNMAKAGAASQKQLDDANSRVEEINKQIKAEESSLGITTRNIGQQTKPLKVQIREIEDQLAKCRIVNPVNGTVLAKYVEPFEMATPGKPLYKIANLSSLVLRAYVTGEQLPRIKVEQPVKVYADNGTDSYLEYPGNITWISDKAEFTPKTIMTKDERADLVYAIKVLVKNDGHLKIGMYGEVKF